MYHVGSQRGCSSQPEYFCYALLKFLSKSRWGIKARDVGPLPVGHIGGGGIDSVRPVMPIWLLKKENMLPIRMHQ